MLRRTRLRHVLLMIAAAMLLTGPALADDDSEDQESEHHEREQMHDAVERGEIKSLVDVLKAVRAELPGEVVGVEAERSGGKWVYELRVTGRDGHIFEAEVDAASARILKIEEK